MAKALPFFKFDADDWLTGKIQLLSAVEKGIFIDLVARMWKENGLLKNDEVLHRLIRVQKGTLIKSLEAFFSIGIMFEENGFLRVKFVDEQLNQRNNYIECQRNIGKRGGRPKKGMKPKQKEESREQKEESREQKEESREQKEENTVSSLRSDTPPDPEKSGDPGMRSEPKKIFFDYDGDAKIHGITQEQLALWKENFPALDVEQELGKASAWLDGNRKNRKQDVKRFLVNWLNRAQDRAPKVANQPPGKGTSRI